MLIAGERRSGAREDVIRNPFDGSEVGRVAAGEPSDVERAISAAFAARRELAALPAHVRADVATRVASRLRERTEELARLIACESGKPIRFARAEVARAALTFDLAAGEARTFAGQMHPLDLEARGEGRIAFTLRVPRGVVAAISPFNFPLNLVAHKLAPAWAVGAPCVLKPAPQCPLTALTLVEWMLELGCPASAISALHCPPPVAEALVRDERVAALSFTGSDAVGWRLKSIAGKKHVVLELGGNAPCIVDETVAWERAVEPLVLSAFAYGGQVCIKTQRILVHASRFDAFVERFVAVARALACGDPLDERTVVGPLIEERHIERVLAWIEEARVQGARVLCGAKRVGQIVMPTVLVGAPPSARVCTDEVFGPVVTIEAFDEFSDALERCNHSRYGLQVGVYTADLSRALLAARTLEFGGVILNDTPTFRIDASPYGGTKDSGSGREGVRAAMEELSEPRLIVLRPAP